MQNASAIVEQNKQLQKENGRLTEENNGLRKRIASIDENAIGRLREQKNAEIKELQEQLGKAESKAVRSDNIASRERKRADKAEDQIREMLDIPEIKKFWESIQLNKEALQSRSRLTNTLKMALQPSGGMQMAKTTTSNQRRVTLLHGASLLKHLDMVLILLTKSNAGWLLAIC